MSERKEQDNGWHFAGNQQHYFVDGKSLCGGWGWLDRLTTVRTDLGDEPGEFECAECWAKAKEWKVLQ